MREPHASRHPRLTRELFLSTFEPGGTAIEPWVVDRLTSLVEEEEARAGETLFAQGDPAEFFYFMRDGRIDLVRDGRPARRVEGRAVFGMFDALLDRPRARAAIARSDVSLMRVRADAWMELLEDSFETSRAMVVSLARAVADLEERAWTAGKYAVVPRAAAGAPPGVLTELERMAVMLDTPLLRRAGVQALSDLASASQQIELPPGELLFARGAPPAAMYVLIDGELRAARTAPDAAWPAAPAAIVCGAAALCDRIGAWEARAASRARLLALPLEEWWDSLEEHFEAVRAALAVLSDERERLLDALTDAREAEGGTP